MATSGSNVQFDRHTYEDPFLDMASTKLPKSFKKLLELCQIFAMTHPQISPIIQRLAEYPITSLTYKAEDEESKRQHKELFEKHLRILEKMVEWGLDYHAYGNCFVSISFPFVRLYQCKTCNDVLQANKLKYTYRGGKFEGICHRCRGEREFKPIDQYVKNPREINVFRIEPQLVTPKYNRVTGKYKYYYSIPPDTSRAVAVGDRDVIDGTPVEYLECIRLKRKMVLQRVFHFKRPTLSGRDMQWGFPLVLPALKDAYLNQIYKKADEAVALEHSVPLRILYPEPRTQDPMQKLALGNFRRFMSRNIRYWRRDKNAIITAPMPIGITNIGGDGQAYSTIQARIKVVDEIMGAMMVTRGFVMGGENWSSASISQRVMENSFLNYLRRLDACLQWVRDEIAAFLNLPKCTVAMKPFKKVDDVQMLQLILQLAREKRVSWEEALSRMDLDATKELEVIERETEKYTDLMLQELVAQNDANARALISQTVAQQEAEGHSAINQEQQASGQELLAEIEGAAAVTNPDGAAAAQGQGQQPQDRQQMVNIDMGKQIALWAGELLRADSTERRRLLSALHTDSPDVARAVVEVADQMENTGGPPAAQQQDSAVSPARDGASMIQSILAEAKSPDEVAQRMQMVDPRQQTAMLQALARINPRLYSQVLQRMSAMANNVGSAAGGGRGSVDMRPMPEQKPPRREEKPV